MSQPPRIAKLPVTHMVVAALAFVVGLPAAMAADEDDPHALHEQNCTQCHGTEVYTRTDRRIQSLAGLETQVETCNTNLNTGLFPEQVKAIATMLNDEYYQFSD